MNTLISVFCITLFSASLDAQNIGWAQKHTSTSNSFIRKLATDSKENIYNIGVFEGDITFDSAGVGKSIRSFGSRDTYIAKFNKDKHLNWAINAGSNQDDISPGLYMGLDVDSNGNVYSLSTFKGTATISSISGSGSTITSFGGFDMFLSKHDSNGVLNWILQIGGTADESSYTLKVKNGSLYIGGSFNTTCTFNTTSGSGRNVTSAGGEDAFVAKYDLNGVLDWVTTGGGSGLDIANDLDVTSNGDIYVAGNFGCCGPSNITLGASTISNQGGWGGFIAKVNASGQWVWAIAMGGVQSEGINIIACDNLGNIFAAGIFENANTTISSRSPGTSTTLVNSGGFDAVVLSYDTAGVYRWHKVIGSTARDYVYGIVLNSRNNIVVGGQFANTVNFGGTNLTSEGAWDGYIAEYDKNGNLISILSAGGPTNDEVLCLAADLNGNVIAGGYFTGTAAFGSNVLTSAGGMESFICGVNYNAPTSLRTNNGSLRNHNIIISPNPFVSHIELKTDFEIDSDFEVNIYDLVGKIVYTETYKKEDISVKAVNINIEKALLTPGTYIIDINHGDKHYRTRVVKSN